MLCESYNDSNRAKFIPKIHESYDEYRIPKTRCATVIYPDNKTAKHSTSIRSLSKKNILTMTILYLKFKKIELNLYKGITEMGLTEIDIIENHIIENHIIENHINAKAIYHSIRKY